MTPAQASAIIVTLAGLLAAVSALAGALWWRSRSFPLVRTHQLVRDLLERQRALEALIEKLEARLANPELAPKSALPRGPVKRSRPVASGADRAALIAVPDLSATAQTMPSTRLGERFGEVWDLAEAGNAPEVIARRLGQPVGQVELILGLRRQIASGSRT